MKVQVVNHTQRDIEVHKVGCADIEREQKRMRVNSTWTVEVPEGKTIAEAVAYEIACDFGHVDQDGNLTEDGYPWPPDSIRVLPCCKAAK